MAQADTVEKVKTQLRISHNRLDSEISDIVNACMADLGLVGIIAAQEDPLVLNAIKLFTAAWFLDDPGKGAAFYARYQQLKECLMLSGRYQNAVE